jgi:tRNA A58 N-methylase Trm61
MSEEVARKYLVDVAHGVTFRTERGLVHRLPGEILEAPRGQQVRLHGGQDLVWTVGDLEGAGFLVLLEAETEAAGEGAPAQDEHDEG